MRSPLPALLLLAGIGVGVPASGAEIVFYEHDAFRGRTFVANQSISNFANIGYNDRASSVIVRSGTWQLCSDAYFRGRCVTVTPGDYPSLRSMDLNDMVSSARELEWLGGGSGPASGARVELFEGRGFAGRRFSVNDTVTNFSDVGFNDRASSMVVQAGTWQLCEHADFRGTCQIYGPGRYPDRGGLAGGGGDFPGWGTGARAILYEGQGLSGRVFVINSEVVSNLASTGFNDRAASLRVEGGYWVFCSDANFLGECMTFGPGDYPSLPWGLAYRISSGRRIHGQYPYRENPTWQR
jgi:hypothetical protein